jgi:hypothetical protein
MILEASKWTGKVRIVRVSVMEEEICGGFHGVGRLFCLRKACNSNHHGGRIFDVHDVDSIFITKDNDTAFCTPCLRVSAISGDVLNNWMSKIETKKTWIQKFSAVRPHVIQVSATRMITQGCDGLARWFFKEEIDGMQNTLRYSDDLAGLTYMFCVPKGETDIPRTVYDGTFVINEGPQC